MFNYQIKAGSTDVSVVLRVVDATDGTPETAVDHATSGIDLKYRREGAAAVDITEAALAALTTAHTDGGVEQIGAGYIRVDLPDAAVASGAAGVLVFGSITGMVVIGCYIQLVAYDPFDTVRLGLTALPNAAAEAAGGLFTRGTGAGQINQANNGQIDVNVERWNATAVPAEHSAGYPVVTVKDGTGTGEINTNAGKIVEVETLTGHTAQTGDTYARLGAPTGASISADLVDIEGKVDDLEGRLTNARAANLDNLDAAITTRLASGSYTTPPTAAAIADQVWEETLADHSGTSGSTAAALNAAGSAGDPWATALPGAYGAGTAGKIVGDNLNATVSSRLASGTVASDVTAIKAKTDNLPTDPADQSLLIAATDALVTLIGTPAGASVSADLADIEGKVDDLEGRLTSARATALDNLDATVSSRLASGTVASDVTAIKAKTDNLPASPAAVGSAMTLTSGERTSIAEALLKLDLSTISGEASRSVLNALRFLRNKWAIAGGTLTVRKEDDTTAAWSATVTQTAGNPVSEVDPA
jgi:hypothetical protein